MSQAMADPLTSEIAAKADFSLIRYALCWEDADILLEALQVEPSDICLSISSAGDNTLSLLSCGPRRVVAIDLSPAQMACLELRVAAFRQLDYHDLIALFDGLDGERRVALYDRLRPSLGGTARAIWDAQRGRLLKGMGAIGRFERYLRIFARLVLPLTHDRATIAAAFEKRSEAERARFYDEVWNTRRWRLLTRLFASRRISGALGRDESFFDYAEGEIGRRTLERGRIALVELNPATNPYLRWIAFGHYGSTLPHWLRPENFEPIRNHLDRLELLTVSIEDFLRASAERSLGKLNLSDVFEYVSSENAERCFAEIARVGRHGARLAYWNTFVPRSRPERLAHKIRPLTDLAQRLHAQDKAFFYSAFRVEEVL
jgi:S-adenosylmethionine:diacylglycerol 3-amino-3-carboxypropyl transferase